MTWGLICFAADKALLLVMIFEMCKSENFIFLSTKRYFNMYHNNNLNRIL